ncbi:glycosyltransferase family 2 protein [Pseudolabrys sp.]|uniref:glycosyltransferase family 2 protein n=1 Tax=Pseudolabrys sp. TaxID=1960880 RepID=UPI003D0F8302
MTGNSLPSEAISAVVVSYHPDMAALGSLCRCLQEAGLNVIVVDNSGPTFRFEFPSVGTQLICMGENAGIAKAQNAGIAAARKNGAQAVLFLDQDSRVQPEMLAVLRAAIAGQGPRIVGPLVIDEMPPHHELPSQSLDVRGRSAAVFHAGRNAPYPVDIIIASGTMATLDVFELAGCMDERLFIDYVDSEWCLRCRQAGVPINIVPQAKLSHRIGERSFRVFGCVVFVHSPIRCYYQIRNALILLRYPHWPRYFGIKQVITVLTSRIILIFYADQKRALAKAILMGLLHGIIGKSGRADFQP